MQFFLLWIGAVLLQAAFGKAVLFAAGTPAITAQNNQLAGVFFLTSLALSAWHAWLLFPLGWRFAIWVLLLLPVFTAQWFLFTIPWSPALSFYYLIIQFALSVLRFPLLIGVRRRPWLYLLGGFCERLAFGILNFAFGAGLYQLIARISSNIPMVNANQVFTALGSGVSLLAAAATAAALAWWMPPCERKAG